MGKNLKKRLTPVSVRGCYKPRLNDIKKRNWKIEQLMFEFAPCFVWFAMNPKVSLFALGGNDFASVDGQSYYITGVTSFQLYGGTNKYTITGNTLKIVFNDSSMNKQGTVYSYIALSAV